MKTKLSISSWYLCVATAVFIRGSNYANWNSAAGLAGGPRNRKFNVVKQAVDYDPEAVRGSAATV